MATSPARSILKDVVKRIPMAVPVYKFIKNDFRFLFSFGSKVRDVQGSKMYLNAWEKDRDLRATFRAYAKRLIHEEATTTLISKVVGTGDTFLDLGANIGYFSLLASRLVGPTGTVHSFEPESRNFEFLLRNKELNQYSQLVANNRAVSDKKGTTTLYICPYDTGHHTINQAEGITDYVTSKKYDKDAITSVSIETVSVDEYLGAQNASSIDCLKVDVEGAESLALRGMDKTLRRSKNAKMILEFFPLLLERMHSPPDEFLRLLVGDHGFDLFEIMHDYSSTEREATGLIRKIADFHDILRRYESDKMYHINLFLMKRTDPSYHDTLNKLSSI